MKRRLPIVAVLFFLASFALGAEQAGPNPSNLTPTGSQGVSLFTGAFTYSYPVAVPPGRHGIQPSLALLYNSQALNGWVGMGWDLSLGSIQRSTKNGIPTYNDSSTSLNSQDTFILQFQGATNQLVWISSGTDANGSYAEFRSQVEKSFRRARYYVAAPSFWIVTTKDGVQYQFQGLGQNTNNSQFFYWGLTEVYDTLGNLLQISYPSLANATSSGAPNPDGTPNAIISTGAVVGFMPSTMTYTGSCTPGTCGTITQAGLDQITFQYEVRPDTITSAMVGGEEMITTRLSAITVTSNGNAVRAYQLGYGTNTIGQSLLTSITLVGNDGVSTLPATTFTYQSSATYTVSLSTGYALPVDYTKAELADVNGDGLPDFVQYISGSSSGTWLNTGTSWASSGTWAVPPTALLNSSFQDLGVRFADVINGYGAADVLQSQATSTGAWLNNGSGWTSSGTWAPPANFSDSLYFSSGTFVLDVNGDGLPDVVQNYNFTPWSISANAGSTSIQEFGGIISLGAGAGQPSSSLGIEAPSSQSTGTWTFTLSMDLQQTGVAGDATAYAYINFTDHYAIAFRQDGYPVICSLYRDSTLLTYVTAPSGLTGGFFAPHNWTITRSTSGFMNVSADGVQILSATDNTYTTSTYFEVQAVTTIPDPQVESALAVVNISSVSSVPEPFTNSWLNSGNGWSQNGTWIPPTPLVYVQEVGSSGGTQTDQGVRFVDLNGDGLVDIIQSNGVSTAAWLNNGNGWSLAPQWNPPVAFLNMTANGPVDSGARIVDINGDGLPDIVQYSTGPTTAHVWLNTGNGWLQDDAFASALANVSTNNMLQFTDINGDGVQDVIALSTNPASNQIFLGMTTPYNVMTGINNGLGGTTQISYAFSPPPIARPRVPPVTVVQSIATSDGMSGDAVVTSSYSYAGGLYVSTRPYQDFLGFAQVASTDAAGNYTITNFLQNQNAINNINLYKGIVSAQYKYDDFGDLLSLSTNTVSYANPYPGVYFPFIAETDTTIGSDQSAVNYFYDSYGNVTQEQDSGDVSITGDERTILTTYAASTGPYLVAAPIAKQIFSGIGTSGPLLASTSYYYDSYFTQSSTFTIGELTMIDRMLSGASQHVISTMTYDSYGNVTNTYDPLFNATAGQQGNQVQTTYETTFNQFPQIIQQAVDASSFTYPSESFTYDPGSGHMLSHVDVNGLTTTYNYDVFERLSTAVAPADQVTPSSPTASYQYFIDSSPPQSIISNARVVSGSSMTLTTYEFFDGLGRQIETRAPGPGGKQIVSGQVAFNNLGLAETSYVPVSSATSTSYSAPSGNQPYSTISYDGLYRVIETINPDMTISTQAYDGWTETDTDANGNSKTYVKNAYGEIAQVQEQYSTSTFVTNYQYDLLGNLTVITNSLGQGTTIQYDTLSRKTEMIDPQMGTWQYEYDPNGNLIQQTDSKGQIITMSYDPLNRLTFKVYPDSTTISYSYDAGAFAVGKLASVADLSGNMYLAYDISGNVLNKTRYIDGNVYSSSTTYDDLGRKTSQFFPDGMQLNDSYDASALSIVASTTGLTYATLTYSTTAPMKLGKVAYGNSVTANYAYDPDMYRLSNLLTTVSTTTLQNFSYQYDNVGNISYISDLAGPMTAAFAYDPLDRLIQAGGPYGTNNYSYDSFGNITSNSDNTSGFWSFDDLSAVSPIAGVAVSTDGRVGNGIGFVDGATTVSLSTSSGVSPPGAMTVALWARPRALGTGYLVSKSGSYYFPEFNSNGSVSAELQLSSGTKTWTHTVTTSTSSILNLWSYMAMTFDGSAINLYVNGELWKTEKSTGTITASTSPVVLGAGLTGAIDEVSVYPYALSASEVLDRYQLYPALAPSQPYTPDSYPTTGMTFGVWYTTYTFSFQGWDLNGNNLDYLVNWGDGTGNQDLGTVQSGAVVQATHTWTAGGQFGIQVQGVNLSTSSVWSPSDNILISTYSIQTALEMPILLGASANFATDSSYISSNTVNEPLTGRTIGTSHIVHWGYQGTNIAPSSFTVLYLGPQGPGGADASPTPELNSSDLISYSTSTTPIGTIALNLLEHGTTSYTDANGNFIAENGRWLAYDFENRPINLVTQDGTLDQFQYDYQGRRTEQIVTPISQSSQTTTYAGESYEVSGSTITKYISAGSLRVAMLLNGSTTYFLPDYLGSTNRLVNAKKGVVRTNDYLPFGFMYLTSGSVDDEHKYTGKRLDASTGLYYYGARYYDPLLGQFVSPDSLLQNTYDPQLLNRYVYSRNNPIKLLDTNGHWVQVPVFTLAGAVIGGLGYEGYTAYKYINGEGSQADISAAFWQGARVGGSIGFGLGVGGPAGLYLSGSLGSYFAGASPTQAVANGLIAAEAPAFLAAGAVGTQLALNEFDQSASQAMSNFPQATLAEYYGAQQEVNLSLQYQGSQSLYPESAYQGAMLQQQLAAEEIAGAPFPGSLGYTNHGLDQILSRDGGVGVSSDALEDAWQNPSSITGEIDSLGRTSFELEGENATLSLNAQGGIITAWPNSSAGYRTIDPTDLEPELDPELDPESQ